MIRGSNLGRGERFFLFSKMSRLALGPILVPTNIPSWGVKQSGCDVHHSSTFFCSRMSRSTPLLLPIFLCSVHRSKFIIDLLNTSLQCCFKNNLCYRKHTTSLLKRSVEQRYLRKYSPFLLRIIMNPHT